MTANIRAVPSLYRKGGWGGWDVIRDEPDGTITTLKSGLKPQEARDMAAALRLDEIVKKTDELIELLSAADPEDERVARHFQEPED
jgi:hypothetical protein